MLGPVVAGESKSLPTPVLDEFKFHSPGHRMTVSFHPSLQELKQFTLKLNILLPTCDLIFVNIVEKKKKGFQWFLRIIHERCEKI